MSTLNTLFLVGILLALGGLSSRITRWLKIPQVVGHIMVGILLGVSGLQLLNTENLPNFAIIVNLSLGLVGFTIGGELRWARLKRFGKAILLITMFESLLASIMVFTTVYLLSKNIPLALLLGALAAATAPGGTTSILQEYKARGPLTTTLLGVVGADDAFAIIIYAFASNISKAILSNGTSIQFGAIINIISYDILGSLLVGLIIGFSVSLIMLRVKHHDMKQLIIIAALFICTGIAETYHLSLILSTLSMGVIIGNIRPHRSKGYFEAIQNFATPLFILFFILIGAQLNLSLLPTIGIIGILYIVFRMLGKYFGAYLGAKLSGTRPVVQHYLGLCLFSQAGVAIGLAISAQIEFSKISPEAASLGTFVLSLITSTTFVFQVIGPLFTKYALIKSNETNITH